MIRKYHYPTTGSGNDRTEFYKLDFDHTCNIIQKKLWEFRYYWKKYTSVTPQSAMHDLHHNFSLTAYLKEYDNRVEECIPYLAHMALLIMAKPELAKQRKVAQICRDFAIYSFNPEFEGQEPSEKGEKPSYAAMTGSEFEKLTEAIYGET